MDEPEIECTECGWQGDCGELLCRAEDLEKPVAESRFDVCPDCGETDCFDSYED